MSTALENIDDDLARYELADAAIAKMRDEYMPLTVESLEDKEGLAAVHAARMVVRGHRVQVEKVRKALKADALEYGRRVDGEARRIREQLEPIEEHLAKQEHWVDAEKARLKKEAELAEQRKLDERMRELGEVGSMLAPSSVAVMSDEEYSAALSKARTAYSEQLERERQEDEKRAQEEAKLAAERKALEEAQREQQEREAELRRKEAEVQRQAEEVERAKAEAAEQERLEQARAEAAEEARKEAEAQAALERERAAEQERAAEEERKRLEALRPAGEKTETFAHAINDLAIPDVPWSGAIATILAGAVQDILALVPSQPQPKE